MAMNAMTTQRTEPARPGLRFARVEPRAAVSGGRRIAIELSEVQVWAYRLDEPEDVVDAWSPVLSRDESLRADRFVRREDRGRWIVARGILRHLLGGYCGIDPVDVAFEYGAAGKPGVAASVPASVAFNMAHSHDRALVAVTRGAPVGIDLEQQRDHFDPLPLAHRFFHGAELDAIHAAPVDRQRDAFFRHWVAKEAVLKAQGVGLSFPLDRFCVTFEGEGAIARVQTRDPSTLSPDWIVRMLPLEVGWHGAVAAGGEGWTVRLAS
jgi:4'-phosphopantetheinyl transferase